MPAASPWPLVGRTDELARITHAQNQGRAGVVLHGPSGAGKSRLAREVLANAERGGSDAVWVQATRSATGIALGAFAAVLPSSTRSEDPLELLQRAAQALTTRATGRPLIIGLDDAQWLDPTSATLALHLATTGTAFIVATIRSGEPCPDAVTSLWKDAGAVRIELGLLDETDTDALAEQIVGGPIDRGTRHWVWTTSQGNALFVRELVLGALAGGSLHRVGELWRLPAQAPLSATLSELVSARMAGLSTAQQQVVNLLSLGEPLRLSEMLALVGNDELIAVEARGLLSVEGATGNAEVRLAHPLYAEVTRGALGPLAARDTRLRLVRTIKARESPEPEDTVRLARWLIDAGEPIPVELAVTAGRAANLAGDPDFAATLAELALKTSPSSEASLLLARTLTVRRRFTEAQIVLDTAEAGIDTPEAALDYLEQQSEVLHWGLRRPAGLRAVLDRAALWWPEPDWQDRIAALRLRMTSFQRLGSAITPSPAVPAAAATDPTAPGPVEPAQLANLFYSGQTLQALDLARRIRPTLPLRTLDEAIVLSLWSRIVIETGDDWPALESWMTQALKDAVRLGDHAAAGQAAYTLATLRQGAGRYTEAAAFLAEAEVQLEHRDPVGLLPVVAAAQLELACQRADPAGIDERTQQLRARLGDDEPLAHQMPYVIRAQAWALHARGDPPRAPRLLLAAAAELGPSPVHAARMTYEALRAGAPARRVSPGLDEQRRRCDARLVAAYADHAAALVRDDGPALLLAADELAQIGALRYATEACANAVDAFARHGRDDSARRAAVRAHELHALGNGAALPPMTGIDKTAVTLTTREQQLTRLAGQGLSNAEIADQLVLSIRTVESHLYRAMQKLGITDRRDLRRNT